MLVSPTRPITPESSWVPCRLPKPTRHPIGFFFPLPYTQVPLYMNSFFFPSPHTQMQLCGSRFFFPSPYTQVPLYSNGFFFPSPYTQIQLVPSLFFPLPHGSLKKFSLRRRLRTLHLCNHNRPFWHAHSRIVLRKVQVWVECQNRCPRILVHWGTDREDRNPYGTQPCKANMQLGTPSCRRCGKRFGVTSSFPSLLHSWGEKELHTGNRETHAGFRGA